jgi:hypothetical protein
MTPKDMDKPNEVSSEVYFSLTTLQELQLQPMSCNSHALLKIGVSPQICGEGDLSKAVILNNS